MANMKNFNIRVYGIWIFEDEKVLVSDERIADFCFTKFPGGGLEWGEGLKDCLIREWKEELDVEIEVINHIYTTDFFQLSAFNDSQVISVYYQVKPLQMPSCDFQTKPLNFKQLGHEECLFRWIPIQQLTMQDLTLPIDKQIVSLIKQLNKEE
jgi:ADP-ribose pyrophosphatase YjhB (NUDIX family)